MKLPESQGAVFEGVLLRADVPRPSVGCFSGAVDTSIGAVGNGTMVAIKTRIITDDGSVRERLSSRLFRYD